MQEVKQFRDTSLSNQQFLNFVYFEKRKFKYFIYKIYIHLRYIYKIYKYIIYKKLIK